MHIMKTYKAIYRIVGIAVAITAVYLAGPKVEKARMSLEFPTVPGTLEDIQDSIDRAENARNDIKPGNRSEIFWYGDTIARTDYAVVYLHGYSASKYEGMPVATDYARKYGMNLYMPRLDEHGLETSEPLLYMTADGLWESAKNALAVGEKIGKKVILMSTSTGGTLAIYLAAMYPEKVTGLINFSPNILPANKGISLLSGHWGLQIARAVQGGKYVRVDSSSYHPEQWSEGPRLESTVQLQALIDATMNVETFSRVKAPCLTLSYYKDDEHQDPTVRVEKIRWMSSLLGTPEGEKVYAELPTVGVHPMASGIVSKDIPAVERQVDAFTQDVLGIRPANEGGRTDATRQ